MKKMRTKTFVNVNKKRYIFTCFDLLTESADINWMVVLPILWCCFDYVVFLFVFVWREHWAV